MFTTSPWNRASHNKPNGGIPLAAQAVRSVRPFPATPSHWSQRRGSDMASAILKGMALAALTAFTIPLLILLSPLVIVFIAACVRLGRNPAQQDAYPVVEGSLDLLSAAPASGTELAEVPEPAAAGFDAEPFEGQADESTLCPSPAAGADRTGHWNAAAKAAPYRWN